MGGYDITEVALNDLLMIDKAQGTEAKLTQLIAAVEGAFQLNDDDLELERTDYLFKQIFKCTNKLYSGLSPTERNSGLGKDCFETVVRLLAKYSKESDAEQLIEMYPPAVVGELVEELPVVNGTEENYFTDENDDSDEEVILDVVVTGEDPQNDIPDEEIVFDYNGNQEVDDLESQFDISFAENDSNSYQVAPEEVVELDQVVSESGSSEPDYNFVSRLAGYMVEAQQAAAEDSQKSGDKKPGSMPEELISKPSDSPEEILRKTLAQQEWAMSGKIKKD